MTRKIMIVFGTRPELIKMEPVIISFQENVDIEMFLVHSGQHQDYEMSKIFFEELNLPKPDAFLNVGSGSHASQTARILMKLERVIKKEKPDLVMAEGDTNTVLATSLAAIKLRIPFAHVEAGLRCYDFFMPEEINRVLADHCAQFCFAPTERSALNLLYEGIPPNRIYITGNTIVDSCQRYFDVAKRRSKIIDRLNIRKGKFATLTLHRVENVDVKHRFEKILKAIMKLSEAKIVFPVHPRSKKNARRWGLLEKLARAENIILIDPLGYIDFLCLLGNSSLVLTDSGGVQEEALTLGIPCLTLRNMTERPETVEAGANILVGDDEEKILSYGRRILRDRDFARSMVASSNPLGDGRSGGRIAKICAENCLSTKVVSTALETGSASFRIVKVDNEFDGKQLFKLEEEIASAFVTMLYDETGTPVFPSPEMVVKAGWTLRVFGPANRIKGLGLSC